LFAMWFASGIVTSYQAYPRDIPDTAGGDRLRRTMGDLVAIDGHPSRRMVRAKPRRERHEMHHDARGEPHRKQQAERDTPPAMQCREEAHL
jgi:hypothetical protein